ncbi:UDP-N-acetylenolpyruvoylglucosamine reductase [bacterium HR39]|nr:UDP-N-acetylenolpyruvoylglucosamine reductase [bacterium HR39]
MREVLPPVRGRIERDVELARRTWLRVGGPARFLFVPADLDDLREFLRSRPPELPVLPLGLASNVLVRDGGIDGVVVRLSGPLAEVRVEDDVVVAGGGASDRRVALAAAEAGLSGFEFMVGIPGSIGGAVRMNAGCYGGETADRLLWAEALDPRGELHRLSRDELGFSYRHSELPPGWIVVRAAFRLAAGDPRRIRARMEEIREARARSQPLQVATGGSTFKNPPGAKAWELVDRAGCRGLVRGRAMVSEKHCNFLINLGGARAAELEELGEEVRRRVFERCGVWLEWEIERLGLPAREAVA